MLEVSFALKKDLFLLCLKIYLCFGEKGVEKNKMEAMEKILLSINVIFYSFILCVWLRFQPMQKGKTQFFMCHSQLLDGIYEKEHTFPFNQHKFLFTII